MAPRFWTIHPDRTKWHKCQLGGCIAKHVRVMDHRGTPTQVCFVCFERYQKTMAMLHEHGHKNTQDEPLGNWADLASIS